MYLDIKRHKDIWEQIFLMGDLKYFGREAYFSLIKYFGREAYFSLSFFSFSFGPASNVPKLTHYGVV